jgi:hypothetical protein
MSWFTTRTYFTESMVVTTPSFTFFFCSSIQQHFISSIQGVWSLVRMLSTIVGAQFSTWMAHEALLNMCSMCMHDIPQLRQGIM